MLSRQESDSSIGDLVTRSLSDTPSDCGEKKKTVNIISKNGHICSKIATKKLAKLSKCLVPFNGVSFVPTNVFSYIPQSEGVSLSERETRSPIELSDSCFDSKKELYLLDINIYMSMD